MKMPSVVVNQTGIGMATIKSVLRAKRGAIMTALKANSLVVKLSRIRTTHMTSASLTRGKGTKKIWTGDLRSPAAVPKMMSKMLLATKISKARAGTAATKRSIELVLYTPI